MAGKEEDPKPRTPAEWVTYMLRGVERPSDHTRTHYSRQLPTPKKDLTPADPMGDVLRHKVASLSMLPVNIDDNGVGTVHLSGEVAEKLGFGDEPQLMRDADEAFQNAEVHGTTGLAIWLKPSFADDRNQQTGVGQAELAYPMIQALCSTLSERHGIPIYPAFIPLYRDPKNPSATVVGSVLVLMTDRTQWRQEILLSSVYDDVRRESIKARKSATHAQPSR